MCSKITYTYNSRNNKIKIFDSNGIDVVNKNELVLLQGFRPKMLDQVYEGKADYTITDAFEALELLSKENINIDKIKAALYKSLIHPFYAPLLVVIIFLWCLLVLDF